MASPAIETPVPTPACVRVASEVRWAECVRVGARYTVVVSGVFDMAVFGVIVCRIAAAIEREAEEFLGKLEKG